MSPRISVIMPVYNAMPYLGDAIDSILRQTCRDFEFLIVDDGSTDGSWPFIQRKAAEDGRIVAMRIEHGGIVSALNAGLGAARGELIARMDADDFSRPTRLEEQAAFLDAHAEVAVIGTDLLRIDDRGLPICTKGVQTDHASIERWLLGGRAGAITHATTMTRRSAIDAAGGGYNEACRHAEDLDLFLRIAEHGRLANLDRVLYEVRMHLGSITHRESIRRLYQLKRSIVEQAMARRGLTLASNELLVVDREYSAADHRLLWAWRALGSLHMSTARRHALGVLRSRPWKPRAWAVVLASLAPRGLLLGLRDRHRHRLAVRRTQQDRANAAPGLMR